MCQFWTVFEGDKEGGVTCHRMVHDFDAGHILHQEEVPVLADETALSLNRKLAGASERCFQHVLRLFLEDPGGIPQGRKWNVGEFPYHFRKLPNKGVIEPTWPEDKVERFIRACYFPPLAAALAKAPDGEHHPVKTIEQYWSVRAGEVQPMRSPLQTSAATVKGRLVRIFAVPFFVLAGLTLLIALLWPACVRGGVSCPLAPSSIAQVARGTSARVGVGG